ncbi:sugar O-acetyltransferase [Streptomyces sp. CC210A]|uniref:sugar O-acetyltransferase n=1 Tax=Streptomyces sp. CC210A TaxID=2898184 RepID=UPI001F2B765A|nr:sugar O-acetyltransferase [Streptomyces sp. CC210A]
MSDLDAVKRRLSSGEPYSATDPALGPHRARCMELLDKFNSTALGDFKAREVILGDLLARVEPGGWVMPRFLCEFGFFIELGAGTKINFDAVLLDCAPIVLGADVLLGPRCQLYTANHPHDPQLRRAMWESARPITLHDRVWLGGGVTVLPGVTIGADTVVGAGSVVTRSLPAGVLAVGNPARIVRELT